MHTENTKFAFILTKVGNNQHFVHNEQLSGCNFINLAFSCNLQHCIFYWAVFPGWTSEEFQRNSKPCQL